MRSFGSWFGSLRFRSLWSQCGLRRSALALFILPGLLTVPALLHGQTPEDDLSRITRPWITVTVPSTVPGDTRSEVLAGVIADNLDLTLRLIGEYVVRPRPTVRTTPTDAAEAAAFAESEGLDYLVFGRVSELPEGATLFSLSVYSREDGTVTLEREAVAATVFDTFDVADELAVDILGAFTGQRIAYGRIDLANLAEEPGEYLVYLDGEPAGTNVRVLERVLVGERLVEVVALEGPGAGRTMASQRVLVDEGSRAAVSFFFARPVVPDVAEVEPEPELEPVLEPEPEPETIAAVEPVDLDEHIDSTIPLEYRVYRWRYDERRDQQLWTAAFQIGTGRREQGIPGAATKYRFLGRMDWGGGHSVFLGWERMEFFDQRDVGGMDAAADLDPGASLKYGAPASAETLFVGYGYRLHPLRFLVLTPSVRLGVEREGRLLTLPGDFDPFDSSRPPMPLSEMSQYVAADRSGISLWNIVPGGELSLEWRIRRMSLSAAAGAGAVVATRQRYSNEITSRDRNTGEDRIFPIEGSIPPVRLSWYLLAGIGYSWGGAEDRVIAVPDSVRPFRTYHPDERRGWGVAFYPLAGFAGRIAPGYEGSVFAYPHFGFGLTLAGRSGLILTTHMATEPPQARSTRVVFREDDSDEFGKGRVVSRGGTFSLTNLGLGRRIRLTEALYLRGEYRFTEYDRTPGTETAAFRTDEYDLTHRMWGPHLALEHALPGTSAMVYGGATLYAPAPEGVNDYTRGRSERDGGTSFSPDGWDAGAAEFKGEFGILFRLAGTPQRLLAAPADPGAWRRYTAATSASGSSGISAVDSDLRWWMPQLSLGTGMEFLSDFSNPSGRRQRINGVQLVLPFALRFPFGLELGMQSTIGVGGGTSGVSGPRQKQDVLVPNTDFGDRVEGRPTLNRVTSFEAGYRFRRQERLSFRPGVRLSWADFELWDIRNTLEDGTVLRSSDARMSRADPALYLGPVAEAAWAFSDRLVLRTFGGVQWRISKANHEEAPALAPTIRYKYPETLLFLGSAITMEL